MEQEPQALGDLRLGNLDDPGQPAAKDRPVADAQAQNPGPVGQGLGFHVEGDPFAPPPGAGRVVGEQGLRAHYRDIGTAGVAETEDDAGTDPAPADRNDHDRAAATVRIPRGEPLPDLDAEGGVPGDHRVRVVAAAAKARRRFLHEPVDHHAAGLPVRIREYDPAAERLHRLDLDPGRPVGHDDRRPLAQHPAGERQRLAKVSGRGGDQVIRLRETGEVVRRPELEAAGALERLARQPDGQPQPVLETFGGNPGRGSN